MPQNIYDDPAFFAGYSQFKRSIEGLDGAPEWPTLRSMLPPLQNRRVLDLGCGFGYFTRWAAAQGAASVLGLDFSSKMLARAKGETDHPAVRYVQGDIEKLALPAAAFDLIYSSLALHYVENFAGLCSAVRRLLATDGRFVFSVEHPLFTAPTNMEWQTDADGNTIWPLDNYLVEGRRVRDWIAPGVVKQHRTLASYVNGLIGTGFQIARLEEWGPSAEQIADHPEWANEVHRPPFLLVAANV